MKLLYLLVLTITAWCVISSCQKDDYINDGGRSKAYVDLTTYDFLKSHGKFDSLIKVIDRAGLKDLVNSGITFFACTDYSVASYVAAKKQEKIIETGNENIKFGINDISLQDLDSLKIYMFDGAILREDLSTASSFYTSKFGPLVNVRFMINLRRTNAYSDYVDHVDYLSFTRVAGRLDSEIPDNEYILPWEEDQAYDCQTSGIITKTGVVHVLANTHRLMFNRMSVGGN